MVTWYTVKTAWFKYPKRMVISVAFFGKMQAGVTILLGCFNQQFLKWTKTATVTLEWMAKIKLENVN